MATSQSFAAEMETLSHVVRLVEAFRAFDADNDGSVIAAELGGIMASLGYNSGEKEVQEMMRQGDTNKDGLVSIEEFLNFSTKNLGVGADFATSLGRLFHGFNFDGEEFVTVEEILEANRNMGQENELSVEDCQRIVASMDIDGDGILSLEDLKAIVNALI